MKKIKFGSFPLVEIDEKEQDCIDNYSIKSFADLITMNTQMKKTSSDLQKYITPDVILKYFNSSYLQSTSPLSNDGLANKKMTMTRAFKSLQNFSKIISGNPFYRDRVTYPIYIEHTSKNGSHDYDFILLANDLVQKEILREIKYDDALTLTFLFIKEMLYPTVPLNKIGQSDSYEIRSDIAKFIEFSKNNQTDPITAMVKLIKIAGMKKQKDGKSFKGFVNETKQNKALTSVVSNKFFKLFGGDRKSGQIKDINFLLNEIKHLDIATFFNDNSRINKSSHDQSMSDSHDRRQEKGISTRTQMVSSELERQYIAQKTQDYNKILSMVDSLIAFNSNNVPGKIMEDLDSNIKDASVKISSGGEEVSIDLNFSKITDSIRNDYFEAFMINLVQRLNTLQTRVESATDTVDKLSDGRQTLRSQAIDLESKLHDAREDLTRLTHSSYSDSSDRQNLAYLIDGAKTNIQSYESQLRRLNDNQMFMSQEDRSRENNIDESKKKSLIKYNIEAVQNELVGVLHDIEASVYGDKVEELFKIISAPVVDKNTLMDFLNDNKIYYNIDQLINAIIESLQAQSMEMVQVNDVYNNNNSIRIHQDRIQKYFTDNEKLINENIKKIVDDQLVLLYKRLGRQYANLNSIKSQEYADLRTENNPIIRKTVMEPNNFRTFILNEQTLIGLYETLNYVDTQKYIAGLLAYPPSKISNELNIIKFMIKRLGLESNPVFIINEKQQSVILSQPDFLSLTGSSVFQKIPFRELENICKIDYNKQLWNKSQMFKKDRSGEAKLSQDKALADLSSIEKTIIEIQSNNGTEEEKKRLIKIENAKYSKLKNTHKREIDALKKHASVSAGQEYGTSSYSQEKEFDPEGVHQADLYSDLTRENKSHVKKKKKSNNNRNNNNRNNNNRNNNNINNNRYATGNRYVPKHKKR